MNKLIIIDRRSKNLKKNFEEMGFNVILTMDINSTYEAVRTHPDIQVCYDYFRKVLFVSEETYDYYKENLKDDINIIKGEKIGLNYPENVKYNCVIGGNEIICNEKTVSNVIKNYYLEKGIKIINVKQGYTKCSVINLFNKYITDDEGIYKKLKENNINVLLVRKGMVKLEGMEYGFIGGTSGYDGKKLYFSGDIKMHPDYEEIRKFAKVELVLMEYGKLYDVGSIVII